METSLRVWDNPGRKLQAAEGCAEGVIAYGRHAETGIETATVQCAVCFVVYTDAVLFAVKKINHAAAGIRGTVPYRRCPDCRFADLHPMREGE